MSSFSSPADDEKRPDIRDDPALAGVSPTSGLTSNGEHSAGCDQSSSSDRLPANTAMLAVDANAVACGVRHRDGFEYC